jgi:GrpB-like predicted nucleotidyltransferase (UPF0157 family)
MIEVLPHNPEWIETFHAIAKSLSPRLQGVALSIEHVGSTSVPDLFAKPIIDIAVIVDSPEASKKATLILQSAGYEHRGDLGIKGREAFKRPEGSPKHNLYVAMRDCLSLRNHLAVKKYLLANKNARDEYSRLKIALAKKYPDDGDQYCSAKTDFLVKILEVSGFSQQELDEIREANRAGQTHFAPAVKQAIEKSTAYLSSSEALASIERDPYWPKWDSPWWHMRLLQEMGIPEAIPKIAVQKMTDVLKNHYLPIFPIRAEEIPEGTDPYRKIACHCAVGSMYQVLFACGVNVDQELPWMRPSFLQYQLPDGGLNCDESVYIKENPKSSIVTTLNCLEAVLFCRKQDLTKEETDFLNKGAQYLLRQRLFRKVSTGEAIDSDWLEVKFPRFYEYDFLRGFYFLAKWREHSGFTIPDELVDEVEVLIAKQLTTDGIVLNRYNLFDKRSYNPVADGTWSWGTASEFELFKAVSVAGQVCPPLSKMWDEVRPKAAIVTASYEIAYKNPIRLKAGETVVVKKRETNAEWLGWVFCTDARGIDGWVSEKYLRENGNAAIVLQDYDATELAVQEGEVVKSYYEEFGWCWCRNQVGNKGWVPSKNLNEAKRGAAI